MRQRGGVAVLADGRDDGRGDVDVALVRQDVEQGLECRGVAQVAQEVDQREAHVDVLLHAQMTDDRIDGRAADAHQRLGGGIALAGVLGVGERMEQAIDHRGLRIADQSVDDGLAHAPVLVAEQLEHQRQVAPVGGVRDEVRGLLPRVGVGRAGLFDQQGIGVHVPVLTLSISSLFICTNCCSVSLKISLSRRTRIGTRES